MTSLSSKLGITILLFSWFSTIGWTSSANAGDCRSILRHHMEYDNTEDRGQDIFYVVMAQIAINRIVGMQQSYSLARAISQANDNDLQIVTKHRFAYFLWDPSDYLFDFGKFRLDREALVFVVLYPDGNSTIVPAGSNRPVEIKDMQCYRDHPHGTFITGRYRAGQERSVISISLKNRVLRAPASTRW